LNIINLTVIEGTGDCCAARFTLPRHTAHTAFYFRFEFALDTAIPVLGQAVTCCKSSQQLKNIWLSINENLESE